MATQGERQNFLWRPNTNDSTTLARYEQEAQHWVRAVKTASRPTSSLNGALYGVGVILNFILAILFLLVNVITMIFSWLFKSNKVDKPNKTMNAPPMPSDKELDAMYENIQVKTFE